MSTDTMNSDEVFQNRVLLELQHIRADVGDVRSSLGSDVSSLRSDVTSLRSEVQEFKEDVTIKFARIIDEISELRITTAQGFAALDKRVEILRHRVDRIERYLGL